ncbi:MAG: hypothetical protein ACOYWZ_21880 [Bacillota bacterium]
MKAITFINLLKKTKGNTSVIFICSIIIVALLSALITDIGYIAVERYKLAKNVDLIARIGAEALAESKEKCLEAVKQNTVKRIAGVNNLDIRISDNNREISLYVGKKLNYIFLRYIGFSEKQIHSRVTAKLSNVASYKGIRPFAIEKGEYAFGKQYYLTTTKSVFKKSENGIRVYGLIPLDLGGKNLDTDMIYGYRKKVNIGDLLYSIPDELMEISGESISEIMERCNHDPACTYENYVEGCPKIIVIPVVEKGSYDKEAMKVIGFTTFFIEDGKVEEENSKRSITLKGRFIKYTVNATTSDGMADFGLLGVKLIH